MLLLTDLTLARRLEDVEAFTAEAYARECARRRPDRDIVVEEVAGGRVVFAGAGSPLSEAKAIGLRGPVTEADLDRMEAVVFDRGEPCRVIVCPMADPSFVEGLGRRGYRVLRFENMLAIPLSGDDTEPPAAPGIEVRQIDPAGPEAGLYVKVVAPGFAGPDGPLDEMIEMMETMLGAESASWFLAFLGDEPVGGGAVIVHQGLALFAGAATVPAYRNRGVHAALHFARLAFARRAGCDLAAQGAEPGSTSQRNAERRGLQVAYTRAVLVREPARSG